MCLSLLNETGFIKRVSKQSPMTPNQRHLKCVGLIDLSDHRDMFFDYFKIYFRTKKKMSSGCIHMIHMCK